MSLGHLSLSVFFPGFWDGFLSFLPANTTSPSNCISFSDPDFIAHQTFRSCCSAKDEAVLLLKN